MNDGHTGQVQTGLMNADEPYTDRLLLRPLEVAHTLGIGRSKAYELIGAGVLPSVKIGGSVRVPVDALRAWVRQQVDVGVDQEGR